MKLVFLFMIVMAWIFEPCHARTKVKDPRSLCISCAGDNRDTASCNAAAVEACSSVLGVMQSVRMGAMRQQRGIDMNAYVSGSQFRRLWEGAGYNIHDMDIWLCLSTNTDVVKCEGWANFNTWTVYDAEELVYADMDEWLCTMRYLWVPAFVSSNAGRVKAGQMIELPSDAQCDREL
jgi:hypothetical protein